MTQLQILRIKLPEQIEKEWLGIYLYQIAQEQKARQTSKPDPIYIDRTGCCPNQTD
jgi:hypothetical protein